MGFRFRGGEEGPVLKPWTDKAEERADQSAKNSKKAGAFGHGSSFDGCGADGCRFGGTTQHRKGGEDGDGKGFAWVRPFESGFDEGEDFFMEKFAAAGETLLHRVFGQIEFGSDGFDGAMLAVKKNERFAIEFRDSLEGAPENGGFLLADGVFGRERVGCRRFSKCIEAVRRWKVRDLHDARSYRCGLGQCHKAMHATCRARAKGGDVSRL